MLMTEELAQRDPFVRPCWRWETAQKLADDPGPVTQSADPLIQDAATYLRTDDELRFPAIHAAREIYEADSLERAELEARILAGQSDSKIAQRCHVPPQLIAVYHDLFLWVRGHLKTDWVLTKTVGPSRYDGFQDDELRQVWAFYALAGGPLIVDDVISSFRRNARPKDEPRLSVYLRRDADVRPQFQTELANRVIPMSQDGYPWHIEVGVRLKEIQAIQDHDQAQAAMNELRGLVVDVGRKALAGEPLPSPPQRKPMQESNPQPASQRERQTGETASPSSQFSQSLPGQM